MKGLLFLLPAALLAQEDHSRHDHGAAGLGTVSFPTSCSAAAQPVFTRAVALLHSFGYEESRNTFREAAKADPTCAMAYWGEDQQNRLEPVGTVGGRESRRGDSHHHFLPKGHIDVARN